MIFFKNRLVIVVLTTFLFFISIPIDAHALESIVQKSNYVSLQYSFASINPSNMNVKNKGFTDGTLLGDFSGDIKNSSLIGLEFGHVFAPKINYLSSIFLGMRLWKSLDIYNEGNFTYKRLQPTNHYTYKQNITATGLGVDVSAVLLKMKRISPYVSFEAGAVKLSSENFGFTPAVDNPTTGDDPTKLRFIGENKYNFYYKAEVGVRCLITHHFSLRGGLFYSDLGSFSTGSGVLNKHSVRQMKHKLKASGVAATILYRF